MRADPAHEGLSFPWVVPCPSGFLKLLKGRHCGSHTMLVVRLGGLPCGVSPRWHSRTLSWRGDPRPLDSTPASLNVAPQPSLLQG